MLALLARTDLDGGSPTCGSDSAGTAGAGAVPKTPRREGQTDVHMRLAGSSLVKQEGLDQDAQIAAALQQH